MYTTRTILLCFFAAATTVDSFSVGSAGSRIGLQTGISARSAASAKWTCRGRRDDEGMKTKGGGKQNKKNTIFVPATSRLPWREYRASLVRGETPLHLRRASRESGVWCHEIPFLEPGCLLIESPSRSFDDQSASDHPEMQGVETGRRVILVAKHSPTGGSVGLVINQPTPMCIGDLTHRMPEFGDNAIHMGGNSHLEQKRGRKGKGELHTVHTVRGLKGGEELQDGVFYGADIRQALETVNLGLASSEQFRFFYGSTRWEGGQLEAEIANGDWIMAAACKDVSVRPSNSWDRPIWRLLLDLLGGRHGLMARETYGDI